MDNSSVKDKERVESWACDMLKYWIACHRLILSC